MKTYKEAAEDLVHEFDDLLNPDVLTYKCTESKDCAMLLADKLIDLLPSCDGNPPNLPMNEHNKEYWQRVKDEIPNIKYREWYKDGNVLKVKNAGIRLDISSLYTEPEYKAPDFTINIP